MASPTRPDDIPRDEHLRAALRHAPDAGLQPPPHLRAQIVAAAHRTLAERPAAAPARPRPWWRPGPLGASGALASVLLAGVIGLMWQDGPPGPALDEPADALAPAAAPAAVGPASATIWMQERAGGEPPAPRVQAPPAPPIAARPAPTAVAATPARSAPPPGPDAEATAKRLPPVPVPVPVPQAAAEAPLAAAESPRPPPDTDASTPAPAAPPPAAPTATPLAAAASPGPVPSVSAAEAFSLRPAPLPLTAAAQPAAAGPATALGRQAASPRPEVARARAAESLRWRIDGFDRGTAAPFWLQAAATLDRQAGQPSALDRLPDAHLVELIDAAGAVDQLWLAASQLLWCPADRSGCRLTLLAPAEAEALRRALAPPAETGQPPKRDSR